MHPKTSIEVERKYEVSADTVLPDLLGVAGITQLRASEAIELRAQYFDTEDFALARTGRALRFRTGGHDAGWHIKHRTQEGMRETQWPAEETDTAPSLSVPEAVREALAEELDEQPLDVIATITTQRTTVLLIHTDHREPVAELADDLVTTVDARTQITRSWREWEVELLVTLEKASADALLDAIEQALTSAGAQPSPIAAKLQRALGQDS